MTTQQFNRQDKLYILATICKQKGVTPNHNTYMGIIVGVCAANFGMPKLRAKELAEILTSAYKRDRWANILNEAPEPEAATPQIIVKPETVKATPKQDALILKGMAKRDTFDGVGRLIHKEIEVEIGKYTPEEILETWRTFNPKDTIIQDGNKYLVYWGGKAEVQETRGNRTPIIAQPKPQMFSRLEYQPDTPLEKADYTANKDTEGDITEEEGYIDEEDTPLQETTE